MLPDINVYKILEIIGTIAFASSGAMVAVKRRLDYLGIVVLGVTTAVGGGMCRDILIGQTPPGMFLDPTNTIIAFWTVNCMFLTIRMKWSQLLHLQGETYDNIMNFLDAVGLGLFTATGVNMAISAGFGNNGFLCAFLGVITGVGGGILRDILSGQTPVVLRKHIYAWRLHCRSRLLSALYAGRRSQPVHVFKLLHRGDDPSSGQKV